MSLLPQHRQRQPCLAYCVLCILVLKIMRKGSSRWNERKNTGIAHLSEWTGVTKAIGGCGSDKLCVMSHRHLPGIAKSNVFARQRAQFNQLSLCIYLYVYQWVYPSALVSAGIFSEWAANQHESEILKLGLNNNRAFYYENAVQQWKEQSLTTSAQDGQDLVQKDTVFQHLVLLWAISLILLILSSLSIGFAHAAQPFIRNHCCKQNSGCRCQKYFHFHQILCSINTSPHPKSF